MEDNVELARPHLGGSPKCGFSFRVNRLHEADDKETDGIDMVFATNMMHSLCTS